MTSSVIVSAARTPIGSFQGTLSSVPATQLGSIAIKAVIERSGVKASDMEEVIMGCVLAAGLGQSPARQAALGAGLPKETGVLTVNKVCGSGLKSVMLADQMIRVGDSKVVVAGGMESMTRAPYLLPNAREGLRLGHSQVLDSMVHDGLWDVYNQFHMGKAAELCAREFNMSRELQDDFALESYARAQKAIKEGLFKDEITPVELPSKKGAPVVVATDEEPGKLIAEKFRGLKPVFDPNGTVTAGNASSINDGAAAVVVMSEEEAGRRGVKVMGRIVAHAGYSHAPEWFTTAPEKAIERALQKAGLKVSDIDLFEINEAFSCVALCAIDALKLDPKKVNVHGGAVALGHPIGASGARLLVTLLHAMKRYGAKRGLVSLCIGGGEAVAMIVEQNA